MDTCFSAEAWRGGFYELAMQFSKADHLEEALRAVWAFPALNGCYLQADIDPTKQPRITPTWATLDEKGHLFGIATLPNGKAVGCGVYRVPEDAGSTWLGFYVPMGSLSQAFDVGAYPFADEARSREWREPLENWLAQIGQNVFARSPFRLGLVGFEVSGMGSDAELAFGGVPAERSIGILQPRDHKVIWYPTNQWHHSLLAS
jgi:hypothetical protein